MKNRLRMFAPYFYFRFTRNQSFVMIFEQLRTV